MLDFERYEALTFDCYGTLIDWESGLREALGALLAGAPVAVPGPDDLLELFGRLEAEAEHGAFRPYREVLAAVAHGIAKALGWRVDERRAAAFAASVATWPAFADTRPALTALESRYRLAIVSNVDDDLFAGSAGILGVQFDAVVTALQVRSYKPARPHFDEALRRLRLPRDRVLHVAQSLYHDIAPAKELGFSCVWVDRRGAGRGSGANPPATATPDLTVPDLASLVGAMGLS
jgi:2-haloacid dehalogenase